MRFLCVFRGPEGGGPPSEAEMQAMGVFIGEMASAGVLLATEGCLSSAHGARVRLAGDKFTVTDGPFTETKEVIGGFALMETPSMKEALEWSKRFLKMGGDSEIEIRELHPTPAFVKS